MSNIYKFINYYYDKNSTTPQSQTGYSAYGRGYYKEIGLLPNKKPTMESSSKDGHVADV